jgi:hypothetical protein
VTRQRPAVHRAVDGDTAEHTFPHPPQFLVSVCVSTPFGQVEISVPVVPTKPPELAIPPVPVRLPPAVPRMPPLPMTPPEMVMPPVPAAPPPAVPRTPPELMTPPEVVTGLVPATPPLPATPPVEGVPPEPMTLVVVLTTLVPRIPPADEAPPNPIPPPAPGVLTERGLVQPKTTVAVIMQATSDGCRHDHRLDCTERLRAVKVLTLATTRRIRRFCGEKQPGQSPSRSAWPAPFSQSGPLMIWNMSASTQTIRNRLGWSSGANVGGSRGTSSRGGPSRSQPLSLERALFLLGQKADDVGHHPPRFL